MKMKVLWIFLSEADRHGEMPLYEAIIHQLVNLKVRGATVTTGIMGFGKHHHIHRKHLFGVNDDRPLLITVVDTEAAIQRALPAIKPMVKDGIMLILDADMVV